MTDDLRASPRRRTGRRGKGPSIRTRVLMIALIPSSVMLVTAAAITGYLVKVLISDLIDAGLLIHRPPRPTAAVPDIELPQAVLDGVRKL